MLRPLGRSLDTMAGWPLADSGLPVRIVNCASRAGLNTLGELRQVDRQCILGWKHLGAVSLEQLDAFFHLLDRLANRELTFENARELLETFLGEDELYVLAGRYGLLYPEADLQRRHMTLQQIGNERDLTRERVRQLEANGLQRLRSLAAAACLEPLCRFLEEHLEQQGQAADFSELMDLLGDPILGGYNPVALLHLCAESGAGRITRLPGAFSTLPLPVLKDLQAACRQVLEESGTPLSPGEILHGIPGRLALDLASPERVLDVLARDDQAIVSLRDGLHFFGPAAAENVLYGILASSDESPLHFRKITEIFNSMVLPASQKGAGYVLEHLSRSGRFRRCSSGYYEQA